MKNEIDVCTQKFINKILRDFKKIMSYLKIEKYRLLLDIESDEGFCDIRRKVIILGFKDGVYNRKLLIHECVHATGMNHNIESGYFSTVLLDSYSAKLEDKIFGVHSKEVNQENVQV